MIKQKVTEGLKTGKTVFITKSTLKRKPFSQYSKAQNILFKNLTK